MAKPLEFYFDFSSPYGYLASLRIDELAGRHGRSVSWQPILLGVVMKQTGMTPLISQPIRGPYFRHDLERMARDHKAPLAWPQNFPFHSVAASRAFYWLKDQDDALAVRFAQQVFHTCWGEGRDVAKPEELADGPGRAVGIAASDMVAALAEQSFKDGFCDKFHKFALCDFERVSGVAICIY